MLFILLPTMHKKEGNVNNVRFTHVQKEGKLSMKDTVTVIKRKIDGQSP